MHHCSSARLYIYITWILATNKIADNPSNPQINRSKSPIHHRLSEIRESKPLWRRCGPSFSQIYSGWYCGGQIWKRSQRWVLHAILLPRLTLNGRTAQGRGRDRNGGFRVGMSKGRKGRVREQDNQPESSCSLWCLPIQAAAMATGRSEGAA